MQLYFGPEYGSLAKHHTRRLVEERRASVVLLPRTGQLAFAFLSLVRKASTPWR